MTDLDMKTEVQVQHVLLVDDHPIVRYGLSQLIRQAPDLDVCAEAATGEEALACLENSKPNIVLLDISLPDLNGLELIKLIRSRQKELPILVLSMHDELEYATRALRAGANGYVMKEQADEYVINAIRQALQGKLYVSEKVASQMLRDYVGGGVATADGMDISCLSNREFEVFNLIGNGLSTNRIAERLNLSLKTIEAHKAHIKTKLELEDAAQLMQAAVRWVERQEKL